MIIINGDKQWSPSLSIIRHPNIVLLMAVCCGPTKADMFLAMEPLQTTSLYEQLHGQQMELSSLEAADIVYDVTSGEQCDGYSYTLACVHNS